jgi:DNA polymerase-3 subunit gamma/tau
LGSKLQAWTGVRWALSVTASGGAPSIAEARDADALALHSAAKEVPIVAAVLNAFPDAKIEDLRTAKDIAAKAAEEALAEVDEEWDPFEED